MTESLPGTPVYDTSTNISAVLGKPRASSAGSTRNLVQASGQPSSNRVWQQNAPSCNEQKVQQDVQTGNNSKLSNNLATVPDEKGTGDISMPSNNAGGSTRSLSNKEKLERNSSVESGYSASQFDDVSQSESGDLYKRLVVIPPEVATARDEDGARVTSKTSSLGKIYSQFLFCFVFLVLQSFLFAFNMIYYYQTCL